MSKPINRIIFFDGDCGLCDRSVELLLSLDKNQEFYFAPLNGEKSQQLLGELEEDSIHYYNCGEVYTKGHAVREILRRLPNMRVVYLATLITPNRLLDRAYEIIAERRQELFGSPVCSIDKRIVSDRFLP